jgi:fumarate reductase subunit D
VIPSSVLGLVVLAAALGPGYVFVRIEERRRPRPKRSALLETAELIVIGGFVSTMAFSAVAAIAAQTGWLNEKKLAEDSTAYLLSHVSRFALLLLVALALSCVLTWLAATAIFFRRPPNIRLFSAWDEVFAQKKGIINYATVGLDDGLAIAGDVVGHSVGDRPSDERELILANPEVRVPGKQTFEQAREPLVVLRGDRIRTLSVTPYEGVLPMSERPVKIRKRVKNWWQGRTTDENRPDEGQLRG